MRAGFESMISACVISLMACVASASPFPRMKPTTPPGTRASELVCSMSVFFSVDPEQAFRSHAHLDGRGLVTCNNDQGFATEFPVTAEIDAELPPEMMGHGELSFSGNSTPFVVPSDFNQLQDIYSVRGSFGDPRLALRPVSAVADSTLLLRGIHHDLVIEMKLNSKSTRLTKIKISGFRMRFDDSAPDLN